MFDVDASDGDDLAFGLDRDMGLGWNWARASGWSLRTTILRGLLSLIDRLLGIGGEAGVREGVDIVVVVVFGVVVL